MTKRRARLTTGDGKAFVNETKWAPRVSPHKKLEPHEKLMPERDWMKKGRIIKAVKSWCRENNCRYLPYYESESREKLAKRFLAPAGVNRKVNAEFYRLDGDKILLSMEGYSSNVRDQHTYEEYMSPEGYSSEDAYELLRKKFRVSIGRA